MEILSQLPSDWILDTFVPRTRLSPMWLIGLGALAGALGLA